MADSSLPQSLARYSTFTFAPHGHTYICIPMAGHRRSNARMHQQHKRNMWWHHCALGYSKCTDSRMHKYSCRSSTQHSYSNLPPPDKEERLQARRDSGRITRHSVSPQVSAYGGVRATLVLRSLRSGRWEGWRLFCEFGWLMVGLQWQG